MASHHPAPILCQAEGGRVLGSVAVDEIEALRPQQPTSAQNGIRAAPFLEPCAVGWDPQFASALVDVRARSRGQRSKMPVSTQPQELLDHAEGLSAPAKTGFAVKNAHTVTLPASRCGWPRGSSRSIADAGKLLRGGQATPRRLSVADEGTTGLSRRAVATRGRGFSRLPPDDARSDRKIGSRYRIERRWNSAAANAVIAERIAGELLPLATRGAGR